ncbi:MAG: ATP-binding protein [Thermomicrobiales bacterium]
MAAMDSVEDLAQQLDRTFDAELTDRVGALERGLLALEEADGASVAAHAFDTLHDAAYNLQGAARVIDLADVAHLAGARGGVRHRAPAGHAAQRGLVRGGAARGRLTPGARGGRAARHSPAGVLRRAGRSRRAARHRRTARPGSGDRGSPAAPAAPATAPSADSVRVNVGKLDTLLAQTGELAVTRIRVGQRLAELTELRDALAEWQREWRASRRGRAVLRRQLDVLGANRASPANYRRCCAPQARRGESARPRAACRRPGDPAARGCHATWAGRGRAGRRGAGRAPPAGGERLRAVRAARARLAREQGKPINLIMTGGETEIDRKILERLRDPLMHMLRNAVDHGIESPQARAAASKPATGRIQPAVANRGGAIEIALTDDGGGLDPARLQATAVRKGLLSPERAAALDEEGSFALIFQPGFSTTPVATATSGRGVGMDVVRDEVARLGGHIHTASALGRGTTFTITVPLTLATTRAILVEQGGRTFAIPSAPIERTARVRISALVALEGRRAVLVEGRPVLVVELADLLQVPPATRPTDPRARRSFIVLRQMSAGWRC